MKSTEQLIAFLNVESKELIKKLTPETKPVFGQMDAQQMVEHLALALQIGNGKLKLELATPADKVERVKAIGLMSERPFQPGFKNVALPAEPIPHIHASLTDAISALYKELEDLHRLFTQNNTQTKLHNVFGELNYEEWLWFNYKHFMHHFSQFQLVSGEL